MGPNPIPSIESSVRIPEKKDYVDGSQVPDISPQSSIRINYNRMRDIQQRRKVSILDSEGKYIL
jgi:hypothetical protein